MGQNVKLRDEDYKYLEAEGTKGNFGDDWSMSSIIHKLVVQHQGNHEVTPQVTPQDSHAATAPELAEKINLIDARLKNIQDKIAKLEQYYFEIMNKIHGGK